MVKLKHIKQPNQCKDEKFLTFNNLDVVHGSFFTALGGSLITFACLFGNQRFKIGLTSWNLISRWIPFDIARPLLDKKRYAVLSDFAILQNGESSPPDVSENVKEVQHDDDIHQDSNDSFMGEDEAMIDHESESSDDESDPESSGLTSVDIEDGDISNILIGLKGSHFRYKV